MEVGNWSGACILRNKGNEGGKERVSEGLRKEGWEGDSE